MKKILASLLGVLFAFSLFAQDSTQTIQDSSQAGSLLLINGKLIPFRYIESNGFDIVYRTPERNKLKKIDPERVFAIQYMDGRERVVFQRDTLDPLEFTEEEMRLFIKGEQDASRLYHNNWNKVGGFTAGVASSYFGFYGLVGPFLYTTLFGAFTPNVEKIEGVDPELIKIPEYREGFEKKARDRKIRNGLISGFIGFAVGSIAFSIIANNDND